jgi:hypothetical protein
VEHIITVLDEILRFCQKNRKIQFLVYLILPILATFYEIKNDVLKKVGKGKG